MLSPAEATALAAIYSATNGDTWRDHTGWSFGGGSDPCTDVWFGVSCGPDAAGLWTLALPGNNLTGTLPDDMGNCAEIMYVVVFWW